MNGRMIECMNVCMYKWAPGVGGSAGSSRGQSLRIALISGSTRLAKVLAHAILFPRGGHHQVLVECL